MLKKVCAVLLAGCLLLAAGCGSKQDAASGETGTTQSSETTQTGETAESIVESGPTESGPTATGSRPAAAQTTKKAATTKAAATTKSGGTGEWVESTAGFQADGPVSPEFTSAQKKEQRQAAVEMTRALNTAAREGKKTFTIAPGDYRFANNSGLTLENYKNIHIVAKGVTFWFERLESALLTDPQGLDIENCTNVTLEGLIVDFDPPLFVQGKITAFDAMKNTVDITVDDGFPMPDNYTGQAILYKKDGTIMPQGVLFHEGFQQTGDRTLRVSMGGDTFAVGNSSAGLKKAFGNRVVLEKGDYLALPMRRGRAVYVGGCTGVTLKNVYIYASPGMGILEGFGSANVYDGVKLKRRPGSKRLLVSMADGFHSYSDTKGPIIRNCEFSDTCDDFINIHGFFAVVAEKQAGNKYLIGTMKGEPLAVGGTLQFYNKDSIDDQGTAKITAVQRSAGDDAKITATLKQMAVHQHPEVAAYVVTLDKAVTADKTSLVDIGTHNASGFLIENSYFHSSMGRAILLSGAHDGTVQNNRFRSLNGGVNVSMESHFSMEGQFPENIVIKNNKFEDILGYASVTPQDQPVQGYIYVGMVPAGNYLRGHVRNRNIEITGNTIENPPMTPILVSYTDGVKVQNNKVTNPYFLVGHIGRNRGTNYFTEDPGSIVYVSTSRNVTIKGNTASDPNKFLKSGEFAHKFCSDVK